MSTTIEIPDDLRDSIALATQAAEADANSAAGLALLREPFETFSYRPRVTCRECLTGSCMRHNPQRCDTCHAYVGEHVDIPYIGHAEVTARLLDVDAGWQWEPLDYDHQGLPATTQSDTAGGYAELWIKLTVCGITRIEVGTAEANTRHTAKNLVSDALKRAAMRFGVALEMKFEGDETQTHTHGTPSKFAAKVITELEANQVAAVFNAIPEPDRNKAMVKWTRTLEYPVGYTPAADYTDLFDSATAAVKAHNAAPKFGNINAAKAAVKRYPKVTLKHLEQWSDTHTPPLDVGKLTKGKAAALITLADATGHTPGEVAEQAATYAGLEAAT